MTCADSKLSGAAPADWGGFGARLVSAARRFGPADLSELDAGGDAESISDRYGHGECHALTAAVAEATGLPIWCLRDGDGEVIHSCVAVLPTDGLVFDAYGLVSIESVVARYGRVRDGVTVDRRPALPDQPDVCGLDPDARADARWAAAWLLTRIEDLAGQ